MNQKLLRFGLAIVGGAVLSAGVGSIDAHAKQMAVSITLKPQNQQAMTEAVYDTVDPTSPNYHHYLSTSQVARKFGRSTSDVNQFKRYFKKYNLDTSVYHGRLYLQVRGSYSNLVKAFKARRVIKGKTNKTIYKLPAGLNKQVLAVIGMIAGKAKTAGHVRSHVDLTSQTPNTSLPATDFSKKYGAAKFSSHYQVNKLYDKGLSGAGQQIGLVSGADFRMGDVRRYLTENGISSHVGRINRHYVGPKKDIQKTLTNNSLRMAQVETTLDVDQVASVAPSAGVHVYLFPVASKYVNDETGILNGFAYAIADNKVRQLSSSFSAGNEVSGVAKGSSETVAQYNAAYNLIFQQAALQGMTIFNAAGDNGPYSDPMAKTNLPVAASPYDVQVGGTTLPFEKITSSGQLIKVQAERAWGKTYGLSASVIKQGIFSGGGGGFSRLNSTPRYQLGVPGINTFNAIERLTYRNGKYLLDKSPKMIHGVGHGRNVPDVSGNADQDTGYAVYTTWAKTTDGKPAQKAWL
ncbi:S53 family peptidase, partial [Secundilactobacillus kimchicus]|uniref:S53 family peptidase n=1 Tax=Secundilactobacillus kimchicus TaxID=528209 RepID=UPI001C00F87F